jgi:hypothetical protein
MTYQDFYNTIKQYLRYHPSERAFTDPRDETLKKMRQQLLGLVNKTNSKITIENIIRIDEVATETNNYCHWLSIYCCTIAHN